MSSVLLVLSALAVCVTVGKYDIDLLIELCSELKIIDVERDRQRQRERQRERGREKDRGTEREGGKRAERQRERGREKDRETERERETGRGSEGGT